MKHEYTPRFFAERFGVLRSPGPKNIPMKTSIDRRIIAIAAVCVALNGADAFAAKNRGVTRTGSVPPAVHSASSSARFYKPTAPHFTRPSVIRQPSARTNSSAPAVTKTPAVPPYRPPRPLERKSTSSIVRPQQPATTAIQQDKERPRTWSHNNVKGKSKLDRQSVTRLRDWRGKTDSRAAASAKHREHRHHHHDREWWRHRCHVIVLVGWGYWGWDSGWWYPAWGCDPVYSRYDFDQPVYGYDGLPPDQVVANVQGALQRLGYYRDAVDGVLGPATRAALGNYQRDHGLSASGIIDRETLASLGFI